MKNPKGSAGKRSHSRRESDSENTSTKKGKNIEVVHETRVTRHTLNTISGGFACGCETSSTQKIYARSVINIS